MSDRILIVDDNKPLNDLVGEMLAKEGFDCIQAFDGVEAIDVFNENRPEAVILDLNLLNLPGLEVLRKIKATSPFTVVIILTADSNKQNAVMALKLGADGYLTKPVQRGELLAALGRNLSRARREREVDRHAQWPDEVLDHWMGRILLDAPAALIHVDPANRIRLINRSAARMLGYKPEELYGNDLAGLLPARVGERWVAVLRSDAAKKERGYDGEQFLVRSSGEEFPAHIQAVERPDKGHILICLMDLTQQKALEKEYFEAKKLASLGRVVDGVAHEVRNPLIAIGGFTRKLRRQSGVGSQERGYFDIIVKEVERLERMVSDIERYVNFAQTRKKAFESLNLVEVVRQTFEVVRERMNPEQDGITEKLDISLDELNVIGDLGLLGELFDGLIENAYDAMVNEGGTLTVNVDNIDGWVRTTVSDTGEGIDEKDMADIFDPFFTSKTSGAGLGLSRAYLIVEDHSGHIQFKSRKGEGTTCTVTLPVDRRRIKRDKNH